MPAELPRDSRGSGGILIIDEHRTTKGTAMALPGELRKRRELVAAMLLELQGNRVALAELIGN